MIGSMTLSGVREELQGRLYGGDAEFARISTDTRTLESGALYVALRGPNFDGGRFLSEAHDKGACGAIAETRWKGDMPVLLVGDSTAALGSVARINRRRSRAPLVAVTGSQGKTTSREMLASILGHRHEVLATEGNLNNTIGVPLTLLRLSEAHQYAVVELGANAPGEIACTAAIALPDVALLTNAAATHLEGFGSLEGVVRSKGEIIDALSGEGTAVLNADDPHIAQWVKRAGSRRILTFSIGQAAAADFYASDIETEGAEGIHFTLRTAEGAWPLRLGLAGKHNVANALGAAAAAWAAGAGIEDICQGLEAAAPFHGRLQPLEGPGGSVLIDDSYNASPASFRAAVDVLASCSGERILIAGDMAELGESAESAHRELGEYARGQGIEQLWTLGTLSRLAADSFGFGAQHFRSREELVERCQSTLDSGKVVLVKGSRSARLNEVVESLRQGGAS